MYTIQPFLLALGCVVSAGCGMPPTKHIDAEVLPFYETFVREAATQGIDVSNDDIDIRFVESFDKKNVIGQCASGNKVTLLRSAWVGMSHLKREMLVYHELGHCLLGLEHLPSPSIMEKVFISVEWYEAYRDGAVQEFFNAAKN